MPQVYDDGGIVKLADDGGRIVWSTVQRPVALLPPAYATVLTGYTVSFPDFNKNNAYSYHKDGPGIFDTAYCNSFASILPQEWSSSATVGTIPDGANYIEIIINMSRSNAPDDFLGIPIPVDFASGEDTLAVGGSITVEQGPYWSRGFDIKLSGTNIVLTRYQSVTNLGDIGIWYSGNIEGHPKWSHGGRADGLPAKLLQSKAQPGATNMYRGGSGQCSLTDTSDFSSAYTGTITITPGLARSAL